MEILEGLGAKELSVLRHIGKHVSLGGGQLLFREGQPAWGLYVIIDGTIEIFRTHRDGEHMVAVRGPGEVIGEMGLFKDGGQRTASARARGATVLYEISSDPVEALKQCGDLKAPILLLQNLICALANKFRRRVEANQTAPLSEIAPMKDLVAEFERELGVIVNHLPREGFIRKTVKMEHLGRGEALVRQGDPSDSFFIIHHGNLVVTRRDELGKEKIIDRRAAPTVIGETGFFTGKPRIATVCADGGPVLHSRFPGEEFRKLREKNPAEAIEILYTIARLIIHMNYRYGQSGVAMS
jgi:CRP-like cAMP-binding protein